MPTTMAQPQPAAVSLSDPQRPPTTPAASQLHILLERAYDLPEITLARHRWIHRALLKGRTLADFSLGEIIHITGQTKRRCRDHQKWVVDNSIDDKLMAFQAVNAPVDAEGKSVSSFMFMFSTGTDINIDIKGSAEGETPFRDPLVQLLLDLGWGVVATGPLPNREQIAIDFIAAHGAERVRQAYDYALAMEEKKGPGHITSWPAYITRCLRHPDFNPGNELKVETPAAPTSPTLLPELEADPEYLSRQQEVIVREIGPVEEVLIRDPVERERVRLEWAGHRWLMKCPLFKLEEYRDFLWAWVRQISGAQGGGMG